jgi:membrane protease YdiL (CAAX protease family)
MEPKEIPNGSSKYLILYFLLAFAFSWAIGIPLALGQAGLLIPAPPLWLHYLVAYGPFFSALIVTWVSEGRPGLSLLAHRITLCRVSPIWWVVALSPLLLGLLIVLVLNLATGVQIGLAALGEVNFLPPLGVGALVLWLLTFGIGEEVGWRGFALPRLQNGRSALSATLILTVFWALWHLPQFFYLFEPGIAIGWLIGLFAGAVLLTWLFNSTGGSVLLVAVWHASFNFITASSAGDGLLAAIVSVIVIAWAVVVIVLFRPANLSTHDKVVAF